MPVHWSSRQLSAWLVKHTRLEGLLSQGRGHTWLKQPAVMGWLHFAMALSLCLLSLSCVAAEMVTQLDHE